MADTMKPLITSYGDKEGAYQLHSTIESLVQQRPFQSRKAYMYSASALLPREYFSRAWIIPKVLQVRRILVLWGKPSVSWTIIERYLMQTRSFAQGGKEVWSAHADPSNTSSELYARRLAQARTAASIRPSFDNLYPDALFLHVLLSFSLGGCSDVRDRIFALLGTPRIRCLGPCINLEPD